MTARDDLARLIFDAAEQGDEWDGLFVGDRAGRARAYRQADAVLSEWLPTLADNEALVHHLVGVNGNHPAEVRAELRALAVTLTPPP